MADAMLGTTSLSYAESFQAEDEIVIGARARAAELGCVPIGPGGGAVLRLLATAIGARAVVEVGTGSVVSGLWLLGGMLPDGVLTTVDLESEHQRAARQAFTDAAIAPTRFRLINGSAGEVLPRLTDAAYDHALWHDRVADPTARDADTVAIREVGKAVRDDARVVSAMLPVGDGLLVAVKR